MGTPAFDPASTPAFLDGNCLAGPLAEVFAVDLTTARRRCPDCGSTEPLAALHVYGPGVYGPGPGWTARCPGCSAIALQMAEHPDATWLRLGGPAAFRIPRTVRNPAG